MSMDEIVGRRYPCRLNRVIDGDTLVLDVDLGFRVTRAVTVRLVGIDAPEVRSSNEGEKARGLAATAHAEEIIKLGTGKWPLELRSSKGKSFDRWLGRVSVRSDAGIFDLGSQMVADGHAVRRSH